MVGTAAAEPLISWRAPVGCSNESEIRGAIEARVKPPRGEPPYAIATVTTDGDEVVAAILLHTKTGLEQREVRGASCDALADAVAWVIAMAWLPREAPVPIVVPPQMVLESPEPPAAPWLHPRASVRMMGDVGTLPGGDVGVGFAAGAGIGDDWELEAAGTWWGTRFASAGGDVGADVGLLAASGRLCWRFACIGGEVGRMTGRAVELMDGRDASLTWAAVTAGGRWRFPLRDQVDVVVDAGIAVAVDRPIFELMDGTEAFRPTPVAARLGVALEIR